MSGMRRLHKSGASLRNSRGNKILFPIVLTEHRSHPLREEEPEPTALFQAIINAEPFKGQPRKAASSSSLWEIRGHLLLMSLQTTEEMGPTLEM